MSLVKSNLFVACLCAFVSCGAMYCYVLNCPFVLICICVCVANFKATETHHIENNNSDNIDKRK